jgi:hypothetical protein
MLFLFEVAVLGCFLGSIRMGFIIMLSIIIFIFRDSRRDSSWYRRLIYECEKNDCVSKLKSFDIYNRFGDP